MKITTQFFSIYLSNYIFCLDPRKKSSIMRYTNSDDKNTQTFHNLKKSIVKLQNEVIVLETAMADVAKRLGSVERKTGL